MARSSSLRSGRRGYRDRVVGERDPIERFLIVCEGEKTEPNYFRAFRVPTNVVKVVGAGANTLRVVERAIDESAKDKYDQVWCVFDRDSFPADQFNGAIRLAEEHKFRVAYSNEAFELWYLLHFAFIDAAISRSEYADRLTKWLGHPYEKNLDTLYEELFHRQKEAIQRAERLLNSYQPANPERDNPSTTVHLLVQELNRFVRWSPT